MVRSFLKATYGATVNVTHLRTIEKRGKLIFSLALTTNLRGLINITKLATVRSLETTFGEFY